MEPPRERAEPRLRFGRDRRLARRRDFDLVYREGDKLVDRHIVLFLRRAEDPSRPTRIGLSVGRRVGDSVRRNRVKRVLREGFRHLVPRWPAGLEIVVVARPGSAPTTRAEAEESLGRLVGRWLRGPLRPSGRGRRGEPPGGGSRPGPAPASPAAPRPGTAPDPPAGT